MFVHIVEKHVQNAMVMLQMVMDFMFALIAVKNMNINAMFVEVLKEDLVPLVQLAQERSAINVLNLTSVQFVEEDANARSKF
jgi:hypothetical protein